MIADKEAAKIIKSNFSKYLFALFGKINSSINITDPTAINVSTSKNS